MHGQSELMDCQNCTMAKVDPSHSTRWSKWKCCAFQPFLPNYVCGELLAAKSLILPLGTDKLVVNPIGLIPSLEFRNRHQERGEFNIDVSVQCHFYDLDNRSCRIWANRPSECREYWCLPQNREADRHKRAEAGYQQEVTRAQQALLSLGFSLSQIHQFIDQLNEPSLNMPSLAAEEAVDLYQRCWHFVKNERSNFKS